MEYLSAFLDQFTCLVPPYAIEGRDLKGYGKAIVIIVILLVVGAVGIAVGLRFLKRDLADDKQIPSTHQPSLTTVSQTSTVSSDPAINALMTRYGLNLKSATYLAGAKTQVVSQDKTSIHLAFTFPDGKTADQITTIQPDQHYTPTPVELQRAAQTGRQAYNVKFSATPDRSEITLEYFVPSTALPADVQQAIHDQSLSAAWLQLVPSAWAQSGGGAGAGLGIKSVFGGLGSGIMGIFGAMGKSRDNQNWLDELDALEDCVKNPTNQLTQQEYGKNPTYQDQTLSSIEGAKSQIQQVTAARYLGQLSSTGAGALLKGPWGPLLGGVNFLNDMTLQDVANQQMADIGKSVVMCPENNPPDQPKGDGTIVYTMHKEQSGDTEDRLYQGTFRLQRGPVEFLVNLTGTAEIQSKAISIKAGTTYTCKGVAQVHGHGGMGSLGIAIDTVGNCEMNDHGRALHHPLYASQGIDCSFENVDLVNGGSYEVQSEGEEAQWTTCTLELKPMQK